MQSEIEVEAGNLDLHGSVVLSRKFINAQIRPGLPAADFLMLPRGGMARRGRRKHSVAREPNGRASRRREDFGSPFLAIQRVASVDPQTAQTALRCLTVPGTDREAPPLLATLSRARNPNLSDCNPLGLAFERGLLSWSDGDRNSDGSESLRAGIRYGQLHAVVWRGLRGDLAACPTLSVDDLRELLVTGSVDPPAPPSSFFRKLVAADRASPPRPDADEYQKLRERAGDRLGQARSILLKQSMTHGMGVVLRIEKILTLDEMPAWLKAGHRYTAADQHEAHALRDVLKELAGHFGYLGRGGDKA
jgi:hypothetical protein